MAGDMEWVLMGFAVFLILKKLDRIFGGKEEPDEPTDMVELYEEMEDRRTQNKIERRALEETAKVGMVLVAGNYGFKRGWDLGKNRVALGHF